MANRQQNYSVKQLATLSGVSVRTLHYYDEIGLLVPSVRTGAGYRFYSEAELLRLQQILFYRELDMPLKEIMEMLNDPEFNLVRALEQHKVALQARKNKVEELLVTINKTIDHLKQKTKMKPEDLYEGLPKETAEAYKKQAIKNYGIESVERSEKALLKFTKEEFKLLGWEQNEIRTGIMELMKSEKPESQPVQNLIERHYVVTRKFWGTHGSDDKQAEQYAGLGQLYVHDERFMAINGEPQPEFALFMSKAMKYFSETRLK